MCGVNSLKERISIKFFFIRLNGSRHHDGKILNSQKKMRKLQNSQEEEENGEKIQEISNKK